MPPATDTTTSPVMETLTDVQDRFIDAVESAREPMVKGVRRVTAWVDEQFADRELPSLPFADKLPSAAELAENQHRFFARLNDSSYQLVTAVLDAGETAEPVVKAAKEPVAEKTSAQAA